MLKPRVLAEWLSCKKAVSHVRYEIAVTILLVCQWAIQDSGAVEELPRDNQAGTIDRHGAAQIASRHSQLGELLAFSTSALS